MAGLGKKKNSESAVATNIADSEIVYFYPEEKEEENDDDNDNEKKKRVLSLPIFVETQRISIRPKTPSTVEKKKETEKIITTTTTTTMKATHRMYSKISFRIFDHFSKRKQFKLFLIE